MNYGQFLYLIDWPVNLTFNLITLYVHHFQLIIYMKDIEYIQLLCIGLRYIVIIYQTIYASIIPNLNLCALLLLFISISF